MTPMTPVFDEYHLNCVKACPAESQTASSYVSSTGTHYVAFVDIPETKHSTIGSFTKPAPSTGPFGGAPQTKFEFAFDYAEGPGIDLDFCNEQCCMEDKCNVFEYDYKNAKCKIGRMDKVPSASWIFGHMDLHPHDLYANTNKKRATHFNYYGTGHHLNVEMYLAIQRVKGHDGSPKCLNYRGGKNSDGNPAILTQADHMPPTKSCGCFTFGMKCKGHGWRQPAGDKSPAACQDECKASLWCKYFVYDYKLQKCELTYSSQETDCSPDTFDSNPDTVRYVSGPASCRGSLTPKKSNRGWVTCPALEIRGCPFTNSFISVAPCTVGNFWWSQAFNTAVQVGQMCEASPSSSFMSYFGLGGCPLDPDYKGVTNCGDKLVLFRTA